MRTPASEKSSKPVVKSVLCVSASAVAGSSGSLPAIALSKSAASCTVRVIGPAVSCVALIGTTCVRLTIPTVALKPTMPLTLAGQVIEPLVSVPIAAQAKPAAIAAPLPDDEPQALRSVACGLRVNPPIALHPLVERLSRMFAHSLKLVLPMITPPFARILAISGASRPVALSLNASDPAVVGHSNVSILSFTSTVRPSSGMPASLASLA